MIVNRVQIPTWIECRAVETCKGVTVLRLDLVFVGRLLTGVDEGRIMGAADIHLIGNRN